MTRRIVVLGAGYAGLPAAGRLANQVGPDEAEITLVSASDTFLERPRLHQVATGQRPRELPLAGVLGDWVEPLIARVTGIDLDVRRVRLDTPDCSRSLGYDTLVYALGSTVETTSVPGVAEHAHTLADGASARRLHHALDGLGHGGAVTVCGGGLCGVEMAAELAESRPDLRVTLVSRTEPGAWLSPRARRYLSRAFARLGVEVTVTEVVQAGPDALMLAGGRHLPHDLFVWAGGFAVPSLARDAGMEVNAQGRVLVDATMRSRSHPDVYAIGDAAAASGAWGKALAYGCRSGGFTGPYAADAIADRLAGRTPRPFRFRYFHECVSLGRKDAFIQFLRADESPHRYVLTGRPAVWYKNIVLTSAKTLFRRPGPYLPRRGRDGRPAEPVAAAS